jgi:hypothetical protein
MDRYSYLFDRAYADVNDELEQAWGAVETASGPASADGTNGAGRVPPHDTPREETAANLAD